MKQTKAAIRTHQNMKLSWICLSVELIQKWGAYRQRSFYLKESNVSNTEGNHVRERGTMCAYYIYIYIYIYLDLRLSSIFSAHSSFCLDLRSFWFFFCSLELEIGVVFLLGIFAYFPGKYAHNISFKMHKMQKCRHWCNYAHLEKKPLRKLSISNELYLSVLIAFPRMQVHVYYVYYATIYMSATIFAYYFR